MRFLKTAAALGLAAAAFAPAFAGEDKADAPELAGYVRTGDTESCITARQIDQMKILNSHQILVEMKGGAAYLNEPNGRLSKNYALKYEVSAGQLCSSTIVKLVNTGAGGSDMGTIGLNAFQKLEKKTASN